MIREELKILIVSQQPDGLAVAMPCYHECWDQKWKALGFFTSLLMSQLLCIDMSSRFAAYSEIKMSSASFTGRVISQIIIPHREFQKQGLQEEFLGLNPKFRIGRCN